MIFKGFTDENGNVIPVQAAGTVYDEEKNSLALGKETSAVGQDQLVFGRKNIADATKVEIVGGGNFTAYALGDVIQPVNLDRHEGAMIYAGHSLEELCQYLYTAYGLSPESVVINDIHRTVGGYDTNHQYKSFDVPNVSNYDKVVFVVADYPSNLINYDPEGGEYVPADDGALYIYGYDLENEIIFQPMSEAQGHFYYNTENSERYFTNQGIGYFTSGYATLYGCVGNPALGMRWFSADGNFYKSFMKLQEDMGAKNIRTLDWQGNEKLAGGLTVGTGIVIGETSLSEAELIALKTLLNS